RNCSMRLSLRVSARKPGRADMGDGGSCEAWAANATRFALRSCIVVLRSVDARWKKLWITTPTCKSARSQFLRRNKKRSARRALLSMATRAGLCGFRRHDHLDGGFGFGVHVHDHV